MNWLLRPALLAWVSGILALGAAYLVLWPNAPGNRATT